jgi:two-component system sensor histidine kinase DesK
VSRPTGAPPGAATGGRYGSITGVPTVAHWWGARSDPERIELYTRWSFYGFLATSPLLAVLLLGSSPGPWVAGAAMFLGGSVAVAVTSVLVARAGLAGRAQGRPPPARLTAVAVVLALLTAAAGAAAVRDSGAGAPAVLWIVALPPSVVLIAGATVWPTRVLGLAAAGIGGLGGAALLAAGQHPVASLVTAVTSAVAICGVVLSFRFTVWVLDVVSQLDRARDVQARLAVAEERLRFARDLHDVMGRNLSAIAVKGQLAGELVRRGRPEAAQEVADISRIAEESLREVRGVVAGYRGADLAGELVGARSVLRAAGVACTVSGEDDGAALPVQVQTALGWVVREAVTNVLRHSRATSCAVTLRAGTDAAELRVVNDGVPHGPAGDGTGTGLTGLAERLGAVGGRLEAHREDGDFVLTATLPLAARPVEART